MDGSVTMIITRASGLQAFNERFDAYKYNVIGVHGVSPAAAGRFSYMEGCTAAGAHSRLVQPTVRGDSWRRRTHDVCMGCAPARGTYLRHAHHTSVRRDCCVWAPMGFTLGKKGFGMPQGAPQRAR